MLDVCRDCGGEYSTLVDGRCPDCKERAYRRNQEAWREP